MKAVVMDLLRQYLKVEIQFQNGECYRGLRTNSFATEIRKPFFFRMHLLISSTVRSSLHINAERCYHPAQSVLWRCFIFPGHYDKCVFTLREEHKGDMANVLNYIFSHAQVTKKNLLVTMLIVSLCLIACYHVGERFCSFMVYSSDLIICDLPRTNCVVGILRWQMNWWQSWLNLPNWAKQPMRKWHCVLDRYPSSIPIFV